MIEFILASISFFALFYIYVGYRLLLKFFSYVSKLKRSVNDQQFALDNELPVITVLITVYNEQHIIIERIHNVLSCEYPKEKVEVLIASDGSTDSTDLLVNDFDDDRVKLFRPEQRVGKSDTQNQAIKQAKGDVIIFSDAGSIFDVCFLKAIVAPFADLAVGGVDGHLLFTRPDNKNVISYAQSNYWCQELEIRTLESELGILAVASGACMAIRKSLFQPLASAVGEDCLIPLQVVSQGKKMVHVVDAVTYDEMPSTTQGEFKARVRMTLRNWQGTWMFPNLLNPFHKPGIAFALWSHKVLRWLSPFFLLSWLSLGLFSLVNGNVFPLNIHGLAVLLFLVGSMVGLIASYFKWHFPVVGSLYGFCLANAGFFMGVLKGVFKYKQVFYK